MNARYYIGIYANRPNVKSTNEQEKVPQFACNIQDRLLKQVV